ncbi:MAG TPA: hypothetical protein VKB80_27475 [Kofleriaceae bacterium]|nr:hypothetical protein [Kofleriaceae bacterium]
MPTPVIFTKQFAEVVRRLEEQGVSDADPQLFTKFQNAFQVVLGGGVQQRASQIQIDLPDLETGLQAEIVKDNVLALSALYYCAQLEDWKFFAVADKIAEQFTSGAIPVSRSTGGDAIYRWIKQASVRFTESERRGMYARAFGFAQGAVEEEMPNREFSDVWIRFLSAVSVFSREQDATIRKALGSQQVLKAGRDLAVNLSVHGYGVAHFAAVELQEDVRNLLKLFSYDDVLTAYGAGDYSQLIERVSSLYLGGSVNGVRQRTMATTGQRLVRWLADHSQLLLAGNNVTLNLPRPNQPDPHELLVLVDNVERWLAVTGTDDQSIDKFSDPVSMPSQPTIPDMALGGIPDALRDVMKGNGLGSLPGMPSMNVGKA